MDDATYFSSAANRIVYPGETVVVKMDAGSSDPVTYAGFRWVPGLAIADLVVKDPDGTERYVPGLELRDLIPVAR